MKKYNTILACMAMLCSVHAAASQGHLSSSGFSGSSGTPVTDHAVGLRISGGIKNNGVGAMYQRRLENSKRLELGMAQYYAYNDRDHFVVSGSYQWMWNLIENLNWYAGPEANVLVADGERNSGFGVGFGAQVGIEYHLGLVSAPLLISLDARPIIGFLNRGTTMWSLSLGIKYTWDGY